MSIRKQSLCHEVRHHRSAATEFVVTAMWLGARPGACPHGWSSALGWPRSGGGSRSRLLRVMLWSRPCWWRSFMQCSGAMSRRRSRRVWWRCRRSCVRWTMPGYADAASTRQTAMSRPATRGHIGVGVRAIGGRRSSCRASSTRGCSTAVRALIDTSRCSTRASSDVTLVHRKVWGSASAWHDWSTTSTPARSNDARAGATWSQMRTARMILMSGPACNTATERSRSQPTQPTHACPRINAACLSPTQPRANGKR